MSPVEELVWFIQLLFSSFLNYYFCYFIAIVGTGVSHAEVVSLVENTMKDTPLSSKAPATTKSRYFGGEARIEGGPGSEALVAVAFPSVAAYSPEYPAALVLKAVLDTSKRSAVRIKPQVF